MSELEDSISFDKGPCRVGGVYKIVPVIHEKSSFKVVEMPPYRCRGV